MTVSLRSVKVRLGLILAGIAGAAALGVGIWRWTHPQPAPGAAPAYHNEAAPALRSPEERLAALNNSLRAIEDGDRAAPRDRWDPGYIVRLTGSDPSRIFAWVRDSTRWIPYHGLLRGAVGVLMDRRGNSLDRALLLATLLEQAGHRARLAHAELSVETARAVIPNLVVPSPPSVAPTRALDAPPPRLRTIAAQYNLDPAGIWNAAAPNDSAATRFHSELERRVSDQTDRLMKQVSRPAAHRDWNARFERAVRALQDHWWVQRQDGDHWIDLDPLQPEGDSLPARPAPAETLAPGEVSPGKQHLLTIRVIAERWQHGALSEHRILEHVLRPSELHGQSITLQFWPGEWPAQLQSDPDAKLGLRTVSMAQSEWGIALVVGRQAVAQAVLRVDGTPREPPSAGGFGALGAGIAAMASGSTGGSAGSVGGSELTATWIEYEFQTPGDAARVVRRAVFDLLGPAVRSAGSPGQLSLDGTKRLRRSLALMIRTEVLPVTSAMPAEYVAHLTAQAVLANAPLLRLMAPGDSFNPPDPDSLLAKAAPTLTPLYTLAVARFEWSPVNDQIYVDRLGLLTQHRHPAAASNGFEIRGAVDVAAGTVGVSLSELDGYAARLRQGVLDTNAEALWWQGITVLNAGEAYATGDPWVTLASAQAANFEALQLPADAKTRIAQDLAAGFVVVAPSAPVTAGREHFIGWWRIDPQTGEARGIAGNGWGQCQPDYAVLVLETAARGLWSGLFEYGLCHGLWQGINAIKAGAAELQARGVWLTGSARIRFKSAAAVYGENRTQCLISAIGAGVIATLPIILKIRQLQKLKAIEARMAAQPRLPTDRLPRFLEEAEAAHKRAGKASKEAAKKFFKLSEEDPVAAAEAYKEMMVRSREEILAKRDLTAAMEEYKELARAEDRALADLNAEYASELLQLGFGGLLGM